MTASIAPQMSSGPFLSLHQLQICLMLEPEWQEVLWQAGHLAISFVASGVESDTAEKMLCLDLDISS